MKLKKMEVILFLCFVVYFIQSTSTTDGKTVRQHDAAISVLHNWYVCLRSESLTLTPPNILFTIVSKQLKFCLV